VTTDLHLLPPDQWPDRATPPPPPSRRSYRPGTVLLGFLALAAAAGVAVVGPAVIHDLHGQESRAIESGTAPVDDPLVSTTGSQQTTDPAKAVYLITVDACGLQGTGSGFAIDAHHVVTNAHVVQADANPQLRSPTGERYVGHVVGLSKVVVDDRVDPNDTPDVALIELDLPLPNFLSWADAPPQVGQVLSGMTFPDGVFTPTTGTVVTSLAQGFEIRGDFDHGSSGGAVLSPQHEVEGIVTAGTEGGGRAFAYGATALKPLVDGMLANPQALSDDCPHAG